MPRMWIPHPSPSVGLPEGLCIGQGRKLFTVVKCISTIDLLLRALCELFGSVPVTGKLTTGVLLVYCANPGLLSVP